MAREKKNTKRYEIPKDTEGSTKVCLRFPNEVMALLNGFCNERNKTRQHVLNECIKYAINEATKGGAK